LFNTIIIAKSEGFGFPVGEREKIAEMGVIHIL
jgi:hypothetical protein